MLEGTGGPEGWPVPGCGCASCGRLAAGHRRPASILLDGRVRLPPPPWDARALPALPGHRFHLGPDGLEITGPDGERVLFTAPGLRETPGGATGPRGIPGEATGAPFDLVLADLLDRPGHLGDLRHRGRVTSATAVIAVGLDHRVPGENELNRRLAFWGVGAAADGTVIRVPHAVPEAYRPRRTLLLGGSRSGKSEEAELRLAADAAVTYVATGPASEGDPSWSARVRAHRHRRPAHWRTVETTGLAALLAAPPPGSLLIDGLGTWLAAVFDECGAWPGGDGGTDADGGAGAAVAERCDELVAAWRGTRAATVVAVSDEVGLGVIPATPAGRLFRDALGRLNQRLARESEDVALVVAGRVLPLPI
ncbi:bifunctional adenosylcobinamide kinase/adenosylcobinamide-phosphate guanylyltransferase [Microbispora sp. ATCC PTA-5024]|uniref:bifunctional adenosylcobinamide kinase/adenosylcobinamide-phosphate guanylyltransferase n=1 Tax=Microbispora sp. ATCC PTA-5024 TaxID=316330 RepID=UPI0018DCE66A|nr:bifunctional adenosylcobinamide kinase/adenosylcobinamide-phosphate guanylyltransferase [Microbispora sp. ATCC PTA-5024]